MMLLAAINWHSVFFLLTAGFACAFALGVLFSNNVVRMAFYLDHFAGFDGRLIHAGRCSVLGCDADHDLRWRNLGVADFRGHAHSTSFLRVDENKRW